MGGGNTLLPLYAAWKCGLPVIDTDGNGRAVPELNTGLLPVHGIPTSPVILSSEAGDTMVAVITDISIVSQGGLDTGVTTVRADSGETYKAARRMWDHGSPLRRRRQTGAGTICRNAIAVGMR